MTPRWPRAGLGVGSGGGESGECVVKSETCGMGGLRQAGCRAWGVGDRVRTDASGPSGRGGLAISMAAAIGVGIRTGIGTGPAVGLGIAVGIGMGPSGIGMGAE